MRSALLLPLLLVAGRASAQELRELCPERPGLTTPPCTVDTGHLLVETGLADWTHDRQSDMVTDTTLIGQTLLRYGIGEAIEAQLGWTPLGIVRTRDRATGDAMRQTRVGDLFVGVKLNLAHPDGKGFSIALSPSATLPVGREPVGMGDWGAGLRVPVSFDLDDSFQLIATPEVDAAVDGDGDGRHLRFGGNAGVQITISKAVEVTFEGELIRDRDPSGHTSLALASASAGWQPNDNLQLDIGAVAGLNRDSPDIEVYVGVSRRF